MNVLNDALKKRKEQGMKIEELISPVAHILEVVAETWAGLRPVHQTSQESHFKEVGKLGSLSEWRHQQDGRFELE